MIENWNTRFCFTADELGVSKGEYDYVTSDGGLLTREDYEEYAAKAIDKLYKPITILGESFTPSDVAKEMCPDSWDAYVNLCISSQIATEEIKEIR